MRHRVLLAALVPLLLADAGVAAPLPSPDAATVAQLPDALRSWVPWVLHGHEADVCPFFTAGGAGRCLWPGALDLTLGAGGGQFRQRWTAHAEGWASLPGDEHAWPEAVTVDGDAAAVVAREGVPSLRLAPGLHVITGEFSWASAPDSLAVPADVGLLTLTLPSGPARFPDRDESGRLWLRRQSAAATEEDHLDLRVYRKVVDELPLEVITRLDLTVAGRAREVVLHGAQLAGAIPIELASPLPARLEPDGTLRLQLRPGSWQLELRTRQPGPVAELTAPAAATGASDLVPWPAEEAWVFEARPALRVVDVEGVVAVDPSQTTLPSDWQGLPAYRLTPGVALRLVEQRRGDADPAPDRLAVQRVLWLDFDGDGFTVQDQLTGSLVRSSRLELDAPGELQRVTVGGVDQVITRREGSEQAGVEVHQGDLQLVAESRLPRAGAFATLPAVGWAHDFVQAGGRLQLPPGWRLFTVTGIDHAEGTWTGGWRLIDLFLVLLVGFAARRLWGTGWGLLTLAGVVLAYQEAGAPRWTVLVALLTTAIVGLLPDLPRARLLARVAAGGANLVLVLITLAFGVQQIRQAMYPVLEQPWNALGGSSYQDQLAEVQNLNALGYLGSDARAANMAPVAPASEEDVAQSVSKLGSYGRGDEGRAKRDTYQRMEVAQVDPNAVVQTGGGLPHWSWRAHDLSWSGPVDATQAVRLVLLGPSLNALLAVCRVVLLALLALRLLGVSWHGWRPRWHGLGGPALPAAALIAVVALSAAPAVAQAPSTELLDELRARLTARPDCYPSCATASRLLLEVDGGSLRGRLEVGVAVASAVPLPGGSGQWLPAAVQVDGQPAAGLVRGDDGQLWLLLAAGGHDVAFAGPLPDREMVQLPLPLRPHRVSVRVTGWVVDGVHEDGTADDALRLSRTRAIVSPGTSAAGESDRTSALDLPPFLRIERSLLLGLDWRVETRIARLSPLGSPASVEVPLLPGESVTSEGVRVAGGKAQITLGPQTTEAHWSSVLAPAASLPLSAANTTAWAELWRLDASPIWHVEATGLPPIHDPDSQGVPTWRPWPGETLTLAITRPAGVPGQSLTIDQSSLVVTPGLRSSDAVLTLSLRASRGGTHAIGLPPGGELQSLSIDGSEQPIRQSGSKVTFPVHPGSQSVILSWRESRGSGLLFRSSAVDLGQPSVNAETRIETGSPATGGTRWVLLVGGPRMGPAVLFWSLLVMLAAVAVGLARTGLTPLSARDWLLLGLGLSQVPLVAGAFVALWLLALGVRRRVFPELPGRWRHNLGQLALLIWTPAALGVLFWSIYQGLLGSPEMQIRGNGSSGDTLRWFQDRVPALPDTAWALSVPLFVYRLAMLAWALWLAIASLAWLRWAWSAFSAGSLWRPAPPKSPPGEVPREVPAT